MTRRIGIDMAHKMKFRGLRPSDWSHGIAFSEAPADTKISVGRKYFYLKNGKNVQKFDRNGLFMGWI